MSDEGVNTVQFKGRLRLPDDTGGGIPVDLRIDDIFLVLVAEGETLGEWRMDDVGIERVFSNQFLLDLEGEAMVFVADDPLGFAYEGVAEIEAISERLDKRWRSRKKKRRGGSAATVVDADRVDAGRAKERRTAAAESPSVSAVEPAPAPSPEPVESTPPPLPPEVQPPVPALGEPAETQAPDPVLSDSSPTAESPVVEGGVAPDAPAQVAQSPEPGDAEPVVPAPTVEIEVDRGEETAPAEQAAAVLPADDGGPSDADLPTVFTEPEYEVEEVVVPAATSAFAVVEERREEPEKTPVVVEDDGFVAVEPAAPAFAAPAEVAQLSEIPVPAELEDLPEIGAGFVDDRQPVEPVEQEVTIEEVPSSALRAAAAAARAATEDDTRDEMPIEDLTEDDTAPKHLRERKESRKTRVRRRRKPDVVEHEHTYEVKSSVGGIIRRVCTKCGHVSFGSQDVYDDWGA